MADQTVTLTLALPPGALRVEAPRPVCVSQYTAEHVLGLKRRCFLDLLPAYRASGHEVLAAGRARLVALDPFLDWLRAQSMSRPANDTDDGADEAVLAAERALGLRVVGSAKR